MQCDGLKMSEYEAYWLTDFPLINVLVGARLCGVAKKLSGHCRTHSRTTAGILAEPNRHIDIIFMTKQRTINLILHRYYFKNEVLNLVFDSASDCREFDIPCLLVHGFYRC